jgi:hypothetical protein
MAFKFDDNKKVVELSSQNLKYLAHCDARIRGVEASIATPERIAEVRFGHWPGNVMTPEMGELEIARLNKARKDIVKRLTKEEKAEYKAHVKAAASKKLSKEELAARNKQMDQNKDRPSH